MYKKILSITISFIFVFIAIQLQAGILNTKHNLSVSGPGTIKATSERQVCVFCHTPHGASTAGPLWNHTMSTYNYTISDPEYSKQYGTGLQLSTPVLNTIRVDGGSRLCLSCHDGTVALGQLYNAPGSGGAGSVAMTATYMPGIPGAAGSPNLGTNIIGTHLVSIAYNGSSAVADGTLIGDKNQQYQDERTSFKWKYANHSSWTAAGNKIKLRPTGASYKLNTPGTGVQCSTCHNPHGTYCASGAECDTLSNSYRKFLVVDYSNSANLCAFCHCATEIDCPTWWNIF